MHKLNNWYSVRAWVLSSLNPLHQFPLKENGNLKIIWRSLNHHHGKLCVPSVGGSPPHQRSFLRFLSVQRGFPATVACSGVRLQVSMKIPDGFQYSYWSWTLTFRSRWTRSPELRMKTPEEGPGPMDFLFPIIIWCIIWCSLYMWQLLHSQGEGSLVCGSPSGFFIFPIGLCFIGLSFSWAVLRATGFISLFQSNPVYSIVSKPTRAHHKGCSHKPGPHIGLTATVTVLWNKTYCDLLQPEKHKYWKCNKDCAQLESGVEGSAHKAVTSFGLMALWCCTERRGA